MTLANLATGRITMLSEKRKGSDLSAVLVHGGVGRQVSELTRVLYEGGTREELTILRARFWLRD